MTESENPAASAPAARGRTVRILHTSDWHLGRSIAEIDRTADFRAFLDWMLGLLEERRPDVLLIAGDVFDTTMPSTDAQRLYYDFLARAARTPVGRIVITAGNHDSMRFLRAAEPLLEAQRTTVAGSTPEEEAVVVRDECGEPILGIAAVPYLREGDVRLSSIDDTDADRRAAWEAGVSEHYAAVRARLEQRAGVGVPLVAVGHLFVAGSVVSTPEGPVASPEASEAGDAVYVGGLRNVSAAAFGPGWRYIALGHVHSPQTVRSEIPARYCGAPLVLDFGALRDVQQVLEVEISADDVRIESIPVPQPRRLVRLSGRLDEIQDGLVELGRSAPGAVAEAVYRGPALDASTLVGELTRCAQASGVHLAAVRTKLDRDPGATDDVVEGLDTIRPEAVFRSVLERNGVPEDERAALEPLFLEALEAARIACELTEANAAEARRDLNEKTPENRQ